jgi:hypothetical protein
LIEAIQEEFTMKSSTARWTTALAAAVCLATPTAGWSQTPPASQSPTTQQQPPATHHPPTSSTQQSGEAQEHLNKAQAAVKDIPETIPAAAKSRVAELKRHLNALEKAAAAPSTSSGASAQGSKTTARSKNNWSNDVAAIDKILTELLGPASASGASAPTGTTGATGAKSGSSAAMTLDETTKSKLMDVRTHVTAFAAAMSAGSGAASSPASSEPSAADPSTAAAAQPATSPSSTSASSPTAESQSSTPTSQSSQPSQTTSPAAAGEQPATQNPTGAEQAQQPTASANAQVDPEESKRHLTAARESLSQLTQLPAAAQLTGEPRTQVSQLISNFNELITTKENWRASYDKVEANITALIGAESSAEPAPAPAGQAGAVGTSGTAASIDPAIRAKLVEFRNHLKQFEQVAGVPSEPGASQGAGSMSTTQSHSSSSTQPPSSTTSSSSAAGQSTSSTTGQTTAGQSTAGTTGTTGTTSSTEQQSASAMGGDTAMQHIQAIEAILNGRSSSSTSPTDAPTANAPAGTTGATTTGSITLNQSQLEEIRMHLAELRKAVDKK